MSSLEKNSVAELTIHHPDGDIKIALETLEDGGMGGSATKHRNAITRVETARGGTRSREDLKCSTECDEALWALVPKIEDSAHIDRFTCVRQMVDGRDTKIGKPRTFTGVVGNVTPSKYDLSSDAVGMLELELTTDEKAS